MELEAVMMFRNIVKSVSSGVCCAMVVMCSSGVSLMEGDELSSLSVSEKKLIEDHTIPTIYDEYCDGGFCVWKADAERFLTQDFIDECKRTGSIPILNDGRSEFDIWLQYTFAGCLFEVDWYDCDRVVAGEFSNSMSVFYLEHGVFDANSEWVSALKNIAELAKWHPDETIY
jgi:hypothetical protein